ncbi:DUF2339 domain-containing protein [Paenibacillus soyae]|uniref:DUF2339 domain-containing protein n=1 Tax=Paenibacillus soyae TaxID=2969249 RepID=A0A9X2MKQ5_9BACL|nr:DUF2339 domain-containing protein [Paenibacillus soyae]MCR2803728.1 DUF2339 domain-containing protein [Paenibacillus soyae]
MKLNELLKKHWTSLLGALFVITAFITLFQYTVDQGWLTNAMKTGFGLLAGIGVAFAGLKVAQKPAWIITGEIMMGIGACILYATFSFAGIFYAFWEPTLVLLGMAAVTFGIVYYAYRFQSRLLMNIAIVGALLSPLLMRPETDQVFTLFLYLLVLNAAFIAISLVKGWMELRIVSFCGTWLMYTVYFVHFDPSTEGIWSMPIRYALAAFLFYTAALLASSWRNKLSFEGLDLYLNLANGILFGIWALTVWSGDVPYGYTLGFIAIVYLLAGTIVYKLKGKMSVSSAAFGLGGMLLLLMALNSLGEGVLFNVIMWALYACLLTALGAVKRWIAATILGVTIWFFLGVFWYAVTWWTDRGEWFGVYIPFLNWGAVAWMLLAGLGFYYARNLKFDELSPNAGRIFSRIFALLSHLIVGGLMARQIQNLFTEYWTDAPKVYMGLTLSIVWAVYALILMFWGAYYRENTFRWFGSAVLAIVAIKTIFMDLSGEAALFKVLVLLVLGGLSFFMTWMNGKWRADDRASSEPVSKQ